MKIPTPNAFLVIAFFSFLKATMTNTTSGDKIKALTLRVTSKVQGMGIFFLVMPLAQTWHAKHQYKELTYEIL